VVVGGCGKKGPPLPPEPNSPRAALAVALRQIGPVVRVYFTAPQPRGNKPAQQFSGAELVRVEYAPGLTGPPDLEAFRRRGGVVGSLDGTAIVAGERAAVDDGRLVELPDGGEGWLLRFAIRLVDQRGRTSPLATTRDLVLLSPGSPPSGLAAEPTVDGVRLVWEPVPDLPVAEPAGTDDAVPETVAGETDETAGSAETAAGNASASVDAENGEDASVESASADAEHGADTTEAVPPEAARTEAAAGGRRYNIYRASPGEPEPEAPLNDTPLSETEFLDGSVVVGERYVYTVRVLLAEGMPLRESASSQPVGLVAEDRFAPSAPGGLVVVQEGSAVRLFWDPGAERDLGGYRVYRRTADGPWVRIVERVEQPTYVDGEVEVGTTYTYAVTAIDRAEPPNESERSREKVLEIAAEPTTPGGSDR